MCSRAGLSHVPNHTDPQVEPNNTQREREEKKSYSPSMCFPLDDETGNASHSRLL